MISDPATIRTPIDALDAAVEELRSLQCDVDGLQSREATLAIWYAQSVVERLRDNVKLRAPLAPDTHGDLVELRRYASGLEDRLLELEGL